MPYAAPTRPGGPQCRRDAPRPGAAGHLSSAPWRRAPLLLRGRPGVLATVAGACAVLAAPLAAVPLFLSSAGSASVAVQVERCPRDTGATFTQLPAAASGAGTDAAAPFAPLGAWLGPTEGWGRLDDVMLEGTRPDGPRQVRTNVLTRDHALDHVEVLEGATDLDTPGVWLSDRAVDESGVGLGDQAQLGPTRLPVVGVYRDLAGTSVDD